MARRKKEKEFIVTHSIVQYASEAEYLQMKKQAENDIYNILVEIHKELNNNEKPMLIQKK